MSATTTHSFSNEDAFSYMYLAQEREFIKSNESVYKFGRTRGEKNPFKVLPKGSWLILQVVCDELRSSRVHGTIAHQLKKEFKPRNDLGVNYFEGDFRAMMDIVYRESTREGLTPSVPSLPESNVVVPLPETMPMPMPTQKKPKTPKTPKTPKKVVIMEDDQDEHNKMPKTPRTSKPKTPKNVPVTPQPETPVSAPSSVMPQPETPATPSSAEIAAEKRRQYNRRYYLKQKERKLAEKQASLSHTHTPTQTPMPPMLDPQQQTIEECIQRANAKKATMTDEERKAKQRQYAKERYWTKKGLQSL